MIANGTIVDADVNASAAIALSKLATGALPTGITVASANIVDGTIVNADVNASAAIAGTKISPDFGGQNVVTTGNVTGAALIPSSSTVPTNGVYLPSANNVAISTNGTQRLLIEADGDINIDGGGVFYDATNNRLGIGTTSPSARLESEWTGGNQFRAKNGSATFDILNDSTNSKLISSGPLFYATGTSGPHIFQKDGGSSEVARIDGSGRLLVGTSTARANFFNATISPGLQLEGAGSLGAFQRFASITNNFATNGDGGGYFVLARSKGGTVGSTTVVASGDQLGAIGFQGSDGTQFVLGARIEGYVDGTPGADDMPGRLAFSTTADGASNPTERMRITSSGALVLGGGAASTNGSVTLYPNNDSGTATADWRRTATANSAAAIRFFDGTTQVGGITHSNTATAYNTSSDYRLKENVVPLTGAADRLNQLQVKRFNFIADPDKTVDGFIAHEAQAVVPECVTGTKDEVDDEGNPVYQGIDQSKLVPLLTAALQEALAEIESLKARVTALEA
jgi:hypothetical protein